MSTDVKIKKSSRYVLPPWALQDIAWIYYISLLVKHLITYCWKTWADSYQDKIIITTTKNISDNIVYMTKPAKRYWKKHLERCKLHGAQRIKLPEVDGKKERNKVKPTKTEYQLRLSFIIYADFKSVLRKTRVGHRYQNPSSLNTSITYHVGAAYMWNAVMGNTLNHRK